MIPFLIFIVLVLVAWLFVKWVQANDRMSELESRLTQFQFEIERLKKRTVEPAAECKAPPPFPVVPLEALSAQPVVEAPTSTDLSFPLPPVIPRRQAVAMPQTMVPPSAAEPLLSRPSTPAINWENFLGVKLFAWVGGLALFLGVAFFVKYSFENNLISPQLRVTIGYLIGAGLIVGGLWLSRARHAVTVQTLCATGILILYANIFASHAYYKFFDSAPAFALMALVTAGAFVLAVWLDAQVVAVLGLLGGFLTPPLLSTGVDKPLELFGYLALLDLGLLAIALRKRWSYLTLLAAAATVLMQFGWVLRFFDSAKIYIALRIFFGFTVLFVGAFAAAHRAGRVEKWISAAAMLLPAVALGFVFYLLVAPYPELAHRPVLLFSFVFLVDLGFLLMAWLRDDLRVTCFGAGGAIFFLLTIWTVNFLTPELLNAALGFYLLFALLHSIYPVMLQRLRPSTTPLAWVHLYPVLGLLLILVPLFKITTELSFLVWPVVLFLDLVAIGLAMLTASLISILVVFLLTVLATALWIFQLPSELPGLPGMLLVIGGFAIFFMAAALFSARRFLSGRNLSQGQGRISSDGLGSGLTPEMFSQMVALAAMLPFLLLTLVVLRLPLANPSPVFGLAAVLLVLLLGVLLFYEIDLLAVVALAGVLVLESTWHFSRFTPEQIWMSSGWYLGFSLGFWAFPFLFRKRFESRVLPWAVSALALPLHFFLIYRGLKLSFPDFSWFGLLPAVLAVPGALGLLRVIQQVPSGNKLRPALLGFFGGTTLFFITLIFPIQFERQWITISWALEGAALVWLFRRVPHPGLRLIGVGLLVVSFARLALNPWVITSYGRTGQPILNWYLYAYGIVSICLLVSARLLAPPRHRLGEVQAPALLYSLGTILAFLLLNIEIADYFSGPGDHLTFNFSGNLGQDMAYSLGWGLFAFVLLSVGFKTANRPTRYAGMGLLVVTLIKLFLHDLWRLGGLYRIGSLVGLAVLLILISFIYQRFLSSEPVKNS